MVRWWRQSMIHEGDRTVAEMFGLALPSEGRRELGCGMNCGGRSGGRLARTRRSSGIYRGSLGGGGAMADGGTSFV
jgi:hypothetical protein